MPPGSPRVPAPLVGVLVAAAFTGTGRAQSPPPPAFVPAVEPAARLVVAGVDELRAAWPELAIGRMFADLELQEVLTDYAAALRASRARDRAVRAAVLRDPEFTPPDYARARIVKQPPNVLMFDGPWSELRRLELQVLPGVGDLALQEPHFVVVNSCTEAAQGRWERQFLDAQQWLGATGWFENAQPVVVGGMPAPAFTVAEGPAADAPPGAAPVRWFASAPTTFAVGSGPTLPSFGGFDPSPEPEAPGLHVELSMQVYRELLEADAPAAAAFLFGGLARVRLDVQPELGDLVEQFAFELGTTQADATLVGALLAGVGPLPAQPLPDGAIAQLRLRVDAAKLVSGALSALADTAPLPERVRRAAERAFDGRVALGVCAPAPGGLIPRVYVTLGLADEASFRTLFDAFGARLETRAVEYDGVTCTVLQVPGAPQGLQPTLCVLDGLLHVAESGRSLRSYLRARAGGAELPTGAGDAPTAVGEPLANLELWFDPAQLYESYHDLWLPLMMLGASPRLLDRDDLPDPDEFAEHTAPVRVVASRDDDRLLLRSQGTLGGPFLTAWLFSLLPGLASPASELVAIENAYGNHVAQRAAAAIAAFEAREGRRPRDLAELFVAAAWPDEALLLPMDDGAEELQLPGGRRVRTSFRYYADPVEVELFNRGRDAVLLQIRPGSGRIMVEAGGDVRAVYGPAAEQPIDAFGR